MICPFIYLMDSEPSLTLLLNLSTRCVFDERLILLCWRMLLEKSVFTKNTSLNFISNRWQAMISNIHFRYLILFFTDKLDAALVVVSCLGCYQVSSKSALHYNITICSLHRVRKCKRHDWTFSRSFRHLTKHAHYLSRVVKILIIMIINLNSAL